MASYTSPQVVSVAASPPPPTPGPGPMLMSVGGPSVGTLSVGVPDAGPVHISALPLEVDLDLYAGDDFDLDIYVYNPDGSPADCSSAAPMSMVRTTPTDSHIQATLIVTVDPDTTGLLHLSIPSVYSTTLPTNCVYDVQLTIPRITTLIGGAITMHPQVTR